MGTSQAVNWVNLRVRFTLLLDDIGSLYREATAEIYLRENWATFSGHTAAGECINNVDRENGIVHPRLFRARSGWLKQV